MAALLTCYLTNGTLLIMAAGLGQVKLWATALTDDTPCLNEVVEWFMNPKTHHTV